MVSRCSYIVNGSQPVTCNIIGDSPLFYSSYCADSDTITLGDAAGFEEEEFEFDEKTFNLPEFVYTEKLIKDQEFKDYLFNGQLTSSLLKDYVLVYSESGHTVTVEDSWISVPLTMDKAEAYTHTLRLLRINKGLINFHSISYDPDSSILLNRVLEADGVAFSFRGAWEVRLKGWEGPWEYLSYHYPDLSYSFISCAQEDFRSLRSGEAMRAVFEAWFLGDYVNKVDNLTVKTLLGTKAYLDPHNEWLSLSSRDICLITEIEKVSYLRGSNVEVVLTDGVFNEVRGRAEANFIWFMKFERSFKETEKLLELGEEECNVIPINI